MRCWLLIVEYFMTDVGLVQNLIVCIQSVYIRKGSV